MMAFTSESDDTRSRHWLRMPVSEAGNDIELFMFSGLAVIEDIKGTGSDWEGGTCVLRANYSNVIPPKKAILPRHWTIDVHLASFSNEKVANNAGWSVNGFSLYRWTDQQGRDLAVVDGKLVVNSTIAVRDVDAYVLRLSYHVSILGKVVDYKPVIVE